MGPFLQVGGRWEMVQSNGFRVVMDVTQEENRLSAHAWHSAGRVESKEAVGSVNGPHFEMTITWNNDTKGHYTGEWSHGPYTAPPLGYLKGHTQDLNNPSSCASWESDGRVFQYA